MKTNLKSMFVAALWACLCLALSASAQAQTYYTNSASGNWSAAGSWTGTPPSAGGAVDAVVTLAGAVPITANNNLAGAFMLNQLTDSIRTSSSYPTLDDVTVYLNAAAGSSLLFTNLADGTPPVISTRAFCALDVLSPITLANNLSVYPAAVDSWTYLDGDISETTPSSISLDGFGWTLLSGNNTYSGGTIVNYGSFTPGSDHCLGSGLLTWASDDYMYPDRDCTLKNDVWIGGGWTGVNLEIWMDTTYNGTGITLKLLGNLYNDTPPMGGSQPHHLTLHGNGGATAGGNIVLSNAAYLGNLSVYGGLKSCSVAGSFTNWGQTAVGGSATDTNVVLNVLSNATLATIWGGPSGAGFSSRGKVNVYGTCVVGGTYGGPLLYNSGILTVKPYGLFTNVGNINLYGTLNVEQRGTLVTAGWVPIFGTNTTSGLPGSLNVAGTFTANGATVGAGGGYNGGLLNVYSNGVASIGTLEFNSNAVASVAGQLLCSGFQPFVGNGTLRLSDGTNAGFARFSSRGGASVGLVKIIGGAPGMSTLMVSNASYLSATNCVLGGPGINDNNLQLIKANAGTLVLSNSANYYVGDTKVLGGTLALGYPNLATNSTITVTNGVLELDFVATNTVKALVVNGTNTVPGVHNATTDPGILTGTGSLLALTGAGPSYSTTPTNLTFSVTGSGGGSTLHLSWPASHLGWYVQSNSVAVNNTGAWYNVPNSQNGTSLSIPSQAVQTNVYFRMRLP
jgi:autotransporter-associated beta strand protein